MPTDKGTVGVRHPLFAWGLAAGAALLVLLWCGPKADADPPATGPSCGQKVVSSPNGASFRILFATNGFVQRYEVVALADNPEAVNDARKAIELTYGPAGINAPPLKIISFKPAQSGGMMIPDKAIDSCGRTLDFN